MEIVQGKSRSVFGSGSKSSQAGFRTGLIERGAMLFKERVSCET